MKHLRWWHILILIFLIAFSQVDQALMLEYLGHRFGIVEFLFNGFFVGFFSAISSVFHFILSWEFALLLAVILGYLHLRRSR